LATTIYGIKNCDTMKKARAWLDKHGVAYSFHDYKAEGIDKERLALEQGRRLGDAAEPGRHDFPEIARGRQSRSHRKRR
jgi:glutaredoxin